MFSFKLLTSSALVLAAIAGVQAETHTVTFTNNCGSGTVCVVFMSWSP